MFRSQKYTFLNALILTVFIFFIGLALGYWMEGLKVEKINDLYLASELNMVDIKIMSDLLSVEKIDCDTSIKNNVAFGDKIYNEARILEKYELSEKLTESLRGQHYKYDLLRAMFFVNSLKIKEKCNNYPHILLYLYKYDHVDLETKNKQAVMSNMLMKVKEKEGQNIVLIPIAADIDFSSINLIKEEYGIVDLPVVLIDEKIKITDIKTAEEMSEIINAQ